MEKLILLWLPLQGDVQCRHISPESYIVIICKTDFYLWLNEEVVHPEAAGKSPAQKQLLPTAIGGSYYITVLYGKPITNEDSIRTLIAFFNNPQTNTITRGGRGFRPRFCRYTVNNNNKTIQPDWLKTWGVEGGRAGPITSEKRPQKLKLPVFSCISGTIFVAVFQLWFSQLWCRVIRGRIKEKSICVNSPSSEIKRTTLALS